MDLEIAERSRAGSDMTQLVVSERFAKALGGRYRSDGPKSGEEFREDVLVPELRKALGRNEKLTVNFDGVFGMPTSFLEEAFGGLIRAKIAAPDRIIESVEIEAPNSPRLFSFVALARKYMSNEAQRQ